MMKRIGFTPVVVFLMISLVLSSCWKDKTAEWAAQEQSRIDKYLEDNPDFVYTIKESGLYFMETQAGTGELPRQHDTAYVFYKGMFLDGNVFDSNISKDTLIFPVAELWMIPGFDEAITYMKTGSKAKVLIPSKLGYGSTGYYIIPGWEPLFYEISLVRIKPGAGK